VTRAFSLTRTEENGTLALASGRGGFPRPIAASASTTRGLIAGRGIYQATEDERNTFLVIPPLAFYGGGSCQPVNGEPRRTRDSVSALMGGRGPVLWCRVASLCAAELHELAATSALQSQHARMRAESSNRKNALPRKRLSPGNGPVVDPANTRRPGPQATFRERSYKAWASQAQRTANTPRDRLKSLGMRCLC